ncbi:MAG: hypothetical protein ACE5LQ_05220, partial [Candidatus Bipolaricaulia bacterium]
MFLPILLLGLGLSAQGLPCPSLVRLERCAALPLSSPTLDAVSSRPGARPLTALTTVGMIDALLSRVSEEVAQPRAEDREARLSELFWSLGLSLDLQRTSEHPPQKEL